MPLKCPERLAQLLRPVADGVDYASLDPSRLSDDQWYEYIDILGGPIQNQVKSAAKQLKISRAKVGCCNQAGVIFLNTGYSSIPHKLFDAIVHRYCKKDTRQVDFAICISSWMLTNGFESETFFAFAPRKGGNSIVGSIRESFWHEIEMFMTNWAHGGFPHGRDMLQPVEPIAFKNSGTNFSTKPSKLPSELDRQWRTDESD